MTDDVRSVNSNILTPCTCSGLDLLSLTTSSSILSSPPLDGCVLVVGEASPPSKEMKVKRLGRLSSRRYTKSFCTLVVSCFSDSSLSESGLRRFPSQSISPLFQASSFFWYHGGNKSAVRGVVATVVTRAMTTNMVNVLVDKIFA